MPLPSPRRALFVAVLAATSLAACSSDSGKSATPDTQDPPLEVLARLAPEHTGAALAEQAEPAGYTIKVKRFSAEAEPREFERTVTRPFDEKTADGGVHALGFISDSPQAARRVVRVRPLVDDPRPRAYPPNDSFTRAGIRTVAGRDCQVFRKSESEYCVDGAGLVLVSATAKRVDIVEKVTLLATSPDPSSYGAALAAGFTDVELGSLRPVSDTSSPPKATDYALADAPDGFTHVGRYVVVPLSNAILARDSYAIAAGTVDVYVRGADALIIDRGGRLDTGVLTDEDLGTMHDVTNVALGDLGEAEVGTSGNGPFGYGEVRARPAKGRYVVVAGTLPTAQLIEIAKSLRSSPGTDLQYLDGRP